jgi:tetratricopeptide (TPR) repeat protein
LATDAKSKTSDPAVGVHDLEEIVRRQTALGRRLVWLLVIPLLISIVLIPMFFVLNARLAQLENAEKLVTIERIRAEDQNNAWAITEYEKLAAIERNADILARLGVLYFLQNRDDKDRAIRTLFQAREIDSKSWQVYRYLTYIYTATTDYDKAIEFGEIALTLNDQDANTHNNLGWAYSHSDNPKLDLAVRHAATAVGLTKQTQSDYLDTLAVAYKLRGNVTDALLYLRLAHTVASNERRPTLEKKIAQWEMDQKQSSNGEGR